MNDKARDFFAENELTTVFDISQMFEIPEKRAREFGAEFDLKKGQAYIFTKRDAKRVWEELEGEEEEDKEEEENDEDDEGEGEEDNA
jgi:hypothetical protein